MKTTSLKVVLFLGFGFLYMNRIKAQQSKESHTMRIRMVQEKDGKKTEIDTVISDSRNFDAELYLKSKGISLPEKNTGEKDILILRKSGETMDSMVVDGDGKKRIIIRSMEHTGDTPLEMEDVKVLIGDMLTGEKDLLEYMNNDSFHKKIMITRDQQVLIDSSADGKIKRKEIRMIVIKNVLVTSLDQADYKELKLKENDGELKVDQISFYPNPNNGKFRLSFSLPEKGNTSIEISSKEGSKVYYEMLRGFSGNYEKEIDLSAQQKGIYFLTVTQGKRKLYRKLVIE